MESHINKKIFNLYYKDAKEKIDGIKHFAWLPVQMETGEFVWLQNYWEYIPGWFFKSGNHYKLVIGDGTKCYPHHFDGHINCRILDGKHIDEDEWCIDNKDSIGNNYDGK